MIDGGKSVIGDDKDVRLRQHVFRFQRRHYFCEIIIAAPDRCHRGGRAERGFVFGQIWFAQPEERKFRHVVGPEHVR
jgi:hypothetical protein